MCLIDHFLTFASQGVTAPTLLIGFSEGSVWPVGVILLSVSASNGTDVVAMVARFVIVDQSSPYNIILGRPFMVATKACVSLYHMKIKIQAETIVVSIRGDQKMARSCYMAEFKKTLYIWAIENFASISKAGGRTQKDEELEDTGEPRLTDTNPQRLEIAVETVLVSICEADNSTVIRIGAKLDPSLLNKLREFLKEYTDVFAWTHDDMGGINLNIASH